MGEGETMEFWKPVSVPPGYRCPLCPDHRDTDFRRVPVLGEPLCEGCALELSIFAEADERPNERMIDLLEQLTRRPWSELRAALLVALNE